MDRRILEINRFPVLTWSADGTVTGANEALLRLLGYTRREFDAGEIDWDAVTPQEYWELEERNMDQVKRFGHVPAYVKELVRKDGSRIPVYVFSSWNAGNPSYGTYVIVELTNRREPHAAAE